jgi:hypothetical protein
MLYNGRAALHPVAAIEIVHAIDHAVGGMVDMSANDAMRIVAPSFSGNRVFEGTNEVDGALDAVFEVRRQRPVPEPKVPTYPVQRIIEPERELISTVAEEGQPGGRPDDHIELVSMHDDIAASVGCAMHDAPQDLYPAEMHTAEVAQAFVVIAWNEDYMCALPSFAQEFLDDVVMGLRPVRTASHFPKINDISNEIDRVGVVVPKKVEQGRSLRRSRAEVHVRYEDGSIAPSRAKFGQINVECVPHFSTEIRVVFQACDMRIGERTDIGDCPASSPLVPNSYFARNNIAKLEFAAFGVGRSGSIHAD